MPRKIKNNGKNKKDSEEPKKISKEIILEKIKKNMKPTTVKEIFNEWFNNYDKEELKKILKEMEDNGEIIKIKDNKYALPEDLNLYIGKLKVHPEGFGFVVIEEKNIEFFISKRGLAGALHEDIVAVSPIGKVKEKSEGVVERIIKRRDPYIIGTFTKFPNDSFAFIIPDNKRITKDIYISNNNFNNAKDGDKVVVKVLFWGDDKKSPEGEVIEILGKPDQPWVDVKAILRDFNIKEFFPENVIKKANSLKMEIDFSKRKDLRDKLIFTIDGDNAKDFDDAVSLEINEKGNYILGVHIADVSSFVKKNSVIDKEAYERGTSIYFLDKVIPMLPENLSNNLCSLVPNQDRLTFSIDIEINKSGNVVSYEIYESVIRSKMRLTYNKVFAYFQGDKNVIDNPEICNTLTEMRKLAEILRRKREINGAIDFDIPEYEVKVDVFGHAYEVKLVERNEAYKLIEEFMLLANKTVAEYVRWLDEDFIYRIHGRPDEKKLASYLDYVRFWGYSIGKKTEIHSSELQNLLKVIKGKTEEYLLRKLLLRTMRKAVYSVNNIGHFGLGFDNYTHFTSPIRRYPDLVVHRILKSILNNSGKIYSIAELNDIAKTSTEMEQRADEIERKIEELKIMQYLFEFKKNEIFEGIISSVNNFGIFVELVGYGIEGLVKMGSLDDDFYEYIEEEKKLLGRRTRKIYRIGDNIDVYLVDLNFDEQKILLNIYKEENNE